MTKELDALEILGVYKYEILSWTQMSEDDFDIIESSLKDYEYLKEENKLLRKINENLGDNYYDTWFACERLKENNNYALMFIDDIYCLVNTKDNKFDVIDNYRVNNYGIIDNGTKKKLKALEIIKEKDVHIVWLKESRTLEAYNEELEKRRMHDRLLTHEEYDLLKEVLL